MVIVVVTEGKIESFFDFNNIFASREILFLICYLIFETVKKVRVGWKDNVYTVFDPEVVAGSCNHVTLVSDSLDWVMGFITVISTSISV